MLPEERGNPEVPSAASRTFAKGEGGRFEILKESATV